MNQIPTPMGAGFNPHKQNISFFNQDGTTVTVGLHELDSINQANIKVTAIFASQIGAAALLFFVLVMLTKSENRRAPLFLINVLSILIVVVRSVLQILYFVGPWAETYNYVAYYFVDIPKSDKFISMFAGIAQLALHVCIMASLIMQVRVVYATAPKINTIMTLTSVVIATMSVGFFFVAVLQVSQAIMSGTSYNTWVYKASRGIFAGAIFFFSLVFIYKLAFAIHRRKVLKLKKFGPLQVIFIMGCQTMIVPAIFASLENVVGFDGMASLTSTLVVLSLPLSSMWAAAQTESQTSQSTPQDGYRKFNSKASTLVYSSELSSSGKKTASEKKTDSLALHVDKTFGVESSLKSPNHSPAGGAKQQGFEIV